MSRISTKQYDELREALITNLALDFFEDGEIDYILSEIESYDARVRQRVLALFLALSHASSSLVPGLLGRIKTASRHLSLDELDEWLRTAFDLRDSQGIDPALAFLSRVDGQGLNAFQARQGLPLREASPMLETYLRALSGREFRIMPDQDTSTDMVTIYLPQALKVFPERDQNFALYKLAAANAWAQIETGSLTLEIDIKIITGRFEAYPLNHPDIEAFFRLFPDRALALDLYAVIETFRVEYFLLKELPGLMKRAAAIKHALYQERQNLAGLTEKSAFVEGLWQYYLTGKIKGRPTRKLTTAMASLFGIQYETGPKESIKLLYDFYDTAEALPGEYVPVPSPVFTARINPERVSARLQELSAARLKKLEAAITKLINLPDFKAPERHAGKKTAREPLIEPLKEYLLIKGKLVQVDEDLRSLIDQKGGIPGGILVRGNEIGGGSPFVLHDLLEEEDLEAVEGGLAYDEWDYKRGGYKKRWCSLYEEDIRPGHQRFAELTLARYRGYVSVLRKKFELLKRERRLKRRQKDGDDIDFDALVETFSDIRAGVSPAENFFTRVERQERDIAVLFLVDMSGSTRGWVNEAEKESLVLMAEALETLGDRYAVYGFSGMTRNRCDFFRIKGFEEPYGERIKRRIDGIEPRDYTRMAPFIRHAAGLLNAIDARIRLLITLSDSKPEDWDGYKGDYAIEDTRKAVIETRGLGIHPFCITIDREAPLYLPHLFGDGNFIFIDDVRKLPGRITEIYRRLTA